MENATKALLIAGSVLIAIVLIAVGIKILSSTSGVTKEVDNLSSTMEASIFNSRFTQYEGKQKGSEIKNLISQVVLNNANNEHKININIGSVTKQEYGQHLYKDTEVDNELRDAFETTVTYTVKITKVDNKGYIQEIYIYEF